MAVLVSHERGTWPSNADGTARSHYSEPINLAHGAGRLEIFLNLHVRNGTSQARVYYAPSARGDFYASAVEIVPNQKSPGTIMGSLTSDLGAEGRVILIISSSGTATTVSYEAEVITVWKPF